MATDPEASSIIAPTAPAAGTPPVVIADDGSLGSLAQKLLEDGRILIEQEVQLAKAEVEATVRSYAHGGLLAAGGSLLILIGFAVLLAFVVLGLGALMGGRYWLSALMVGAALAGSGAIVLLRGKRRLAGETVIPRSSLNSARETARWARDEASRRNRDNAP